jgi:hypothetical protein
VLLNVVALNDGAVVPALHGLDGVIDTPTEKASPKLDAAPLLKFQLVVSAAMELLSISAYIDLKIPA